jgi:preprotein translocase subunit SecE
MGKNKSKAKDELIVKNVSVDRYSATLNLLKWLLLVLLFAAGVVANAYYGYVAWGIRTSVGIVVLGLVLGVFYTTNQGQKVWSFALSSRGELRKVIWPTRQEAVQTTLMVVVMVVVSALILWGLDALFFWLVSVITGQRGI